MKNHLILLLLLGCFLPLQFQAQDIRGILENMRSGFKMTGTDPLNSSLTILSNGETTGIEMVNADFGTSCLYSDGSKLLNISPEYEMIDIVCLDDAALAVMLFPFILNNDGFTFQGTIQNGVKSTSTFHNPVDGQYFLLEHDAERLYQISVKGSAESVIVNVESMQLGSFTPDNPRRLFDTYEVNGGLTPREISWFDCPKGFFANQQRREEERVAAEKRRKEREEKQKAIEAAKRNEPTERHGMEKKRLKLIYDSFIDEHSDRTIALWKKDLAFDPSGGYRIIRSARGLPGDTKFFPVLVIENQRRDLKVNFDKIKLDNSKDYEIHFSYNPFFPDHELKDHVQFIWGAKGFEDNGMIATLGVGETIVIKSQLGSQSAPALLGMGESKAEDPSKNNGYRMGHIYRRTDLNTFVVRKYKDKFYFFHNGKYLTSEKVSWASGPNVGFGLFENNSLADIMVKYYILEDL